MNSKQLVAVGYVSAAVVTVAIGAFVGYKIATNPEFRLRVTRSASDAYRTSKKKIANMSEDIAIRTAQMTKNPKINQEWIAHQWESVGY